MMEESRNCPETPSGRLRRVMWSYPRGGKLDSRAYTGWTVRALPAHMAALLGAHIIKVKPPSSAVAPEAKAAYEEGQDRHLDSVRRGQAVMQATFQTAGHRGVLGAARPKDLEGLFTEVRTHAACATGGPTARSSGRNTPAPARRGRSTCSTNHRDLNQGKISSNYLLVGPICAANDWVPAGG